jgi:hypothetical protein
MVIHHVQPVVKVTILILLEKRLATFVLPVVNVVIQLFHQSNVKQVNTVKLENFHAQHVLLVIKQFLLVQPIAIFVVQVNIYSFSN